MRAYFVLHKRLFHEECSHFKVDPLLNLAGLFSSSPLQLPVWTRTRSRERRFAAGSRPGEPTPNDQRGIALQLAQRAGWGVCW